MTRSVLSVASETVPLVKTGGLADVVGALPGALAPHDVAVTTMVPGYPAVLRALVDGMVIHVYPSLMGAPARLVAGTVAGLPLIALDAPDLFSRDGGPYAGPQGYDWDDNWRRFAALSRAAADLAGGGTRYPPFDVLHAHDWQAGLAPAYLRFAPPRRAPAPARVTTIHNMAFQGRFGADIFPQLGLPDRAWAIDGVEYYGGTGYLKAGLEASDAITTVSPSYAAEITDPRFGMGLEGVILAHQDRVHGILNGIDGTLWNPETDAHLPARFSARTLARRIENKRALETEFGLVTDHGPLFVVVTRLTWQKGMDALLEVVDHLVGAGGRLALLGAGDAGIEAGFRAAAARHPGRVGVRFGYDEALSHRMQGGGDALLIPSRFEPCGLTQLYALAYGCVPVVARTGGLADTVIDANVAALAADVATGVQFDGVGYHPLRIAINRTLALHRQPELWRRIQRNSMKCDFTWARSGRAYADLYAKLAP
ncbi:MAG: glycogen synthase GlgA [Zavarzinia sp.]|nr:glycogen synthase GlgA [Zavarzinia sp.]